MRKHAVVERLSDLRLTVALLTRISLILGDVIVILVTWVKMHRQLREAVNLRGSIRLSTSAIMITDGMFILKGFHLYTLSIFV